MSEDNKILSSIQIDHIVFNEIQFLRKGFRKNADSGGDVNISVNINDNGEDHYIVSLILNAPKEGEYDAMVKISAYCNVSSKTENLPQILKGNIPAILLPYARAQLTMLTSQPETDPIVLPLINMHEFAKNAFPPDPK